LLQALGLIRRLRYLPQRPREVARSPLVPRLLRPLTSNHLSDRCVEQTFALDAVRLPPVPTSGRRARRFVDRLGSVEVTTGADAGAARQLLGASPYAEVAMTTWSDQVLHEVAVNPRHELVYA